MISSKDQYKLIDFSAVPNAEINGGILPKSSATQTDIRLEDVAFLIEAIFSICGAAQGSTQDYNATHRPRCYFYGRSSHASTFEKYEIGDTLNDERLCYLGSVILGAQGYNSVSSYITNLYRIDSGSFEANYNLPDSSYTYSWTKVLRICPDRVDMSLLPIQSVSKAWQELRKSDISKLYSDLELFFNLTYLVESFYLSFPANTLAIRSATGYWSGQTPSTSSAGTFSMVSQYSAEPDNPGSILYTCLPPQGVSVGGFYRPDFFETFEVWGLVKIEHLTSKFVYNPETHEVEIDEVTSFVKRAMVKLPIVAGDVSVPGPAAKVFMTSSPSATLNFVTRSFVAAGGELLSNPPTSSDTVVGTWDQSIHVTFVDALVRLKVNTERFVF